MNDKSVASQQLAAIYYSPRGYWRGEAAVKKLAAVAQQQGAKVSNDVARDWLRKQAIWQIYFPPPKHIVRPHFNEEKPNAVHQADLLYLPHDRIGRKTYKYALTMVDVASRFKAVEPLTERSATGVAKGLENIYKRGPLTWPRLLQVDPGGEFMGAVNTLLAKHNVEVRRGKVGNHRQQAIVERFNRTLAERIFGAQYAQELLLAARGSSKRSAEWVRQLQDVVTALNNEKTRMLGMKPVDAIKKTRVSLLTHPEKSQIFQWKAPDIDEQVRYLYAPGELEGGDRRRATDPYWSLKTYYIDRILRPPDSPALFFLKGGPTRSFVREELMIVPENTELPPNNVLSSRKI